MPESVATMVAAVWDAPPLRIMSWDADSPNNRNLIEDIGRTRHMTRSWLRVLRSEESLHEVLDEALSVYRTAPFIGLPLDTTRLVLSFALSEVLPPLLVCPANVRTIYIAPCCQIVPSWSYATVEADLVASILEQFTAQEVWLCQAVRSSCQRIMMSNLSAQRAVHRVKDMVRLM